MKPAKSAIRRRYAGAVLIISLIFVLVFSSLAVMLAVISGANVEIAENQRRSDVARGCAESGCEVMRFWLSRIALPGTTTPSQIFPEMAASLQADLSDNSISNITANYNGSTITIPEVTLASAAGQGFCCSISQISPEALRADVTGRYGTLSRTIRANYIFGTRARTVFDYGVATKGALNLAGNIELGGIAVEASVYIESENNNDALSIIGHSQIAGDVYITNPDAVVPEISPSCSIGGESGEAARDHVFTGTEPTEFPVPIPGYFEHYVTNVFDPNTDPTSGVTLENVRILSSNEPVTLENVTLRGVIFIETPNVITFTGNTSITGIIVGNGQLNDNSATNQIIFLGTVDSLPVTELPSEFGQLREETGTFILAPGFRASFGGDFETLNGAIAANGIEFFGNAGGTIEGSVLNYSDTPMTLSGNSDLIFSASGTDKMPVGFGPEIILHYDPESYSEIVL
jgi:hypothetical protein